MLSKFRNRILMLSVWILMAFMSLSAFAKDDSGAETERIWQGMRFGEIFGAARDVIFKIFDIMFGGA